LKQAHVSSALSCNSIKKALQGLLVPSGIVSIPLIHLPQLPAEKAEDTSSGQAVFAENGA
jgi:hypothetical protein